MSDSLPANVIKVSNHGVWHRYVMYADKLLTVEGFSSVSIRAFGDATGLAIKVSEQLRQTILGLHQQITISSVEAKRRVETGVEDLVGPVEDVRRTVCMEITLSKEIREGQSAAGYQEPLSAELVKPYVS